MSKSHKVAVRKDLHSMHQDLSDWSELLNAEEVKMSQYYDLFSPTSLHQSISSYSNQYRPLSVSFQQWENSQMVPAQIGDNTNANYDESSVHCLLQLLAFKLQYASNLKLNKLNDQNVAPNSTTKSKDTISANNNMLTSPTTPVFSEDMLDDPYSAKLDIILESDELDCQFIYGAGATPPNTPFLHPAEFQESFEFAVTENAVNNLEDQQEKEVAENAQYVRAADDISIHSVSSDYESEDVPVESGTYEVQKAELSAHGDLGSKQLRKSDSATTYALAREIYASDMARKAVISGLADGTKKRREPGGHNDQQTPYKGFATSLSNPAAQDFAVPEISQSTLLKTAAICELNTCVKEFEDSESFPVPTKVNSSEFVPEDHSSASSDDSNGQNNFNDLEDYAPDTTKLVNSNATDFEKAIDFESIEASHDYRSRIESQTSAENLSSKEMLSTASTQSSNSTYENDLSSDSCSNFSYQALEDVTKQDFSSSSSLLSSVDGKLKKHGTHFGHDQDCSSQEDVSNSNHISSPVLDDFDKQKTYKQVIEVEEIAYVSSKDVKAPSKKVLVEDASAVYSNQGSCNTILVEEFLVRNANQSRFPSASEEIPCEMQQLQEEIQTGSNLDKSDFELSSSLSSIDSQHLRLNVKPSETIIVKKVELKPLISTSHSRNVFVKDIDQSSSSDELAASAKIGFEQRSAALLEKQTDVLIPDKKTLAPSELISDISSKEHKQGTAIENEQSTDISKNIFDQVVEFAGDSFGSQEESSRSGDHKSMSPSSNKGGQVSDASDTSSEDEAVVQVSGSLTPTVQEISFTLIEDSQRSSSPIKEADINECNQRDNDVFESSESKLKKEQNVKVFSRRLSEDVTASRSKCLFESKKKLFERTPESPIVSSKKTHGYIHSKKVRAARMRFLSYDDDQLEIRDIAGTPNLPSKPSDKSRSMFTPIPYSSSSNVRGPVLASGRRDAYYSNKVEEKRKAFQSKIDSSSPTSPTNPKPPIFPKPKNLLLKSKDLVSVSTEVDSRSSSFDSEVNQVKFHREDDPAVPSLPNSASTNLTEGIMMVFTKVKG